MDITILVVCAVTAGAPGWEAIEEFGKEKLDWLRKFAPFANGVPSHDCIANVVSRLSPKGFQACFRSWTVAVSEATKDEVIAIDGKTARGSRDRKRARKALHMVSAWASTNRLVLAQDRRRLRRGCQPYPQRQRSRDHDLDSPPLHEFVRTGVLVATPVQETPQGSVE